VDLLEHDRAIMLARHRVRDIYGFLESLGGSTVNEKTDLAGNIFTSHFMLKALSLMRGAFTCN
jgi:hypothetical protein